MRAGATYLVTGGFGGISGLLNANLDDLKRIKGLGGPAKRAELAAVLEKALATEEAGDGFFPLGLAAFFGVDVRELPDVDRPVITISADFSGASAETIDRGLANALLNCWIAYP